MFIERWTASNGSIVIVLTDEPAKELARWWRAKQLARFRVGDVVCRVERPEDRGVIVRIWREGDRCFSVMPVRVGDLEIRTRSGCSTVSNRYSDWQHIPRNEQTLEERVRRVALRYDPYVRDDGFLPDDESLGGLLMVELADLSDEQYDNVFDPSGDWPTTFEELAIELARVKQNDTRLFERQRILTLLDWKVAHTWISQQRQKFNERLSK